MTAGENVAFERVFSWLDNNLKNPALFSGTVATNLSSWDSVNNRFNWDNSVGMAPRIVNQIVDVGKRLIAPGGELGASGTYWAGHIRASKGNSFHPTAYKDPFVSGFDAANLGAIIPVNAIPGANSLEVWWFRKNTADQTKGFIDIYWPTVIGDYTIQWPLNSREIVLASNAGSGGLGSLEAKGSIYSQNNSTLPGYNPNEEHALLLGGQAFALRDDLNITTATGYSSHSYVLLEFTNTDGRPSITPFKVLREKPAEGILFDYIAEAGKLLQGPMPLPLLAPPVETISVGLTKNYNTETAANSGDLPVNWDPARDNSSANGPFTHYKRFTYRDRKDGFWIYRGLHTGLPTLDAGLYNAADGLFGALPNVTAVLGQPLTTHVHASRQPQTLVMATSDPLPVGLEIRGLSITGVPTVIETSILSLQITDTADGSTVTQSLTIDVGVGGPAVVQGPLVITSANPFAGGNVSYTNRPPYLAQTPTASNSFTMRFYYKTQAGFDWPGIASPPSVGTIVPYLRRIDGQGAHVGDPAAKTTSALDIVYRPTWPANPPSLSPAQTLTLPVFGLPAVRGQTSFQILYQQSVGSDFNTKVSSVSLHDPTREKTYDVSANALNKIPAGIKTDSFQGLTYFPNLPPHLANRLFFDPARGTKGYLVFRGEFKDELFGQKYILLNVLGVADMARAKALCPAADPDKAKWDQAVAGLTTTLETFREDVTKPGTFIPEPLLSKTVAATSLSDIIDSDTAVDSYALSAGGPGFGYVTLIAGNGSAFTPSGDPVSLYVIRVGGQLHNGELKVLPAANPLNELLTIQHTEDLGARTDQYEYDWRIAPPVDGFPVPISATMSGWQPLAKSTDVPRYTLGGNGIQGLIDNYVTMRFRPTLCTKRHQQTVIGLRGQSQLSLRDGSNEFWQGSIPSINE
jgi:hypothetical protein